MLLCAVAALVAIPTGLLPAATITEAATSDPYDGRHLRPDLLSVALVLVAMPLIAGAATGLVGAIRDKLRPARPDELQLID